MPELPDICSRLSFLKVSVKTAITVRPIVGVLLLKGVVTRMVDDFKICFLKTVLSEDLFDLSFGAKSRPGPTEPEIDECCNGNSSNSQSRTR